MGSVPCTVFVAASCSFEEFVENWTGKATSRGIITWACGSEFSCDIGTETDGPVGAAPEKFSCEESRDIGTKTGGSDGTAPEKFSCEDCSKNSGCTSWEEMDSANSSCTAICAGSVGWRLAGDCW